MNKVTDTLREIVAKSDSEINGDQARLVLDLAKVFNYSGEEFEKSMHDFCLKYLYDISVGNECFYIANPDWKFIVVKIYFEDSKGFFNAVDKDGNVIEDGGLDLIEKTGNYYPIKKFLGGTFE